MTFININSLQCQYFIIILLQQEAQLLMRTPSVTYNLQKWKTAVRFRNNTRAIILLALNPDTVIVTDDRRIVHNDIVLLYSQLKITNMIKLMFITYQLITLLLFIKAPVFAVGGIIWCSRFTIVVFLGL